jgi:signal transduction histidine kinase
VFGFSALLWKHLMSLSVKRIIGTWMLLLIFLQLIAQDQSAVGRYQNFFRETGQPVDKVLVLQESALEEAHETHDLRAEARIRKEIGFLHLTRTHDYEQAMDFFIQALAIEDSLLLKNEQIFTYLGVAQVFEEAGNYLKSSEVLDQALEINRSLNDTRMLVLILNKSGKINALMGKLELALENYEMVLEYKDQLDEPGAEAEALFNIANLRTLQGKYTEALEYHKRALVLWRSLGDRKNEAVCLNSIGTLYRLMKNPEKSLANHVVSLEIRQVLKDKKGIAESYNNIGALYYEQKNIQRAVANLMLALESGREAQAQDQIGKAYEGLSQCYKDAGDYKTALDYKEELLNINEFIQHDKNERQLLETQNRYVIDKKQLEIEKLESIREAREKELAVQKQFRNFLFALIGLSVVIVLLTLYLYVSKRKSNRVLQRANARVNQQNLELVDLNATKDKFFSIISHDLKGPLNSLTSFSGLLINHTDSLSKDEIKMLAKDLDKSLKNLFALLENLLEWSRSQTGNIEFKPELFDLAVLLRQNKELLETQAQNKQITLVQPQVEHLSVNAHKHSVNTVVRNLVSNAIKFTPQGGTIRLELRQSQNEVTVSIADTGVGMSPEVTQKLFRIDTKHTTKGTADEKGTGLGLILCKEFIEKNGGKIWVESTPGKGSVFHFTLPMLSVPASVVPAEAIQ